MQSITILFLHGWHSVVGGVKPTYLKDAHHKVINPPLDDDDFDLAVRTAQAEYDRHKPDVIVGSSRGGAIAMNIHSGDTPLVLLCPAWKNWGTAKTLKGNSVILHSRQDEVIPFADSEELIAKSGLPSNALLEIGNDHRLADPEPLKAMLDACERLVSSRPSILDHPAISGRYLFPQDRTVDDPFLVKVDGAELACYREIVDPDAFSFIHFHGNGEAVADYVPFMASAFADMGLNSLFVEYREYGESTGQAKLVAMLGDGEAVLNASKIPPEKAIVFGRSIGSLYAIELAHRQPGIRGLIIESGIADPSERFLTYADLASAGFDEADVRAEVKRYFNHKQKLSDYTNPLLTLHTENDDLIDISHAERNHKWASSRQKHLIKFPYGNHNSIFGVNEKAYLDAIASFVRSSQR
jgi:alpha-beta hydrolase superfamily lysophospholipase